jgi:hypothetical protein
MLEFKPIAAATKDADKTTVQSHDLRLPVYAEWLETRSHEPVLFFILHLHPGGIERCCSNDFSSFSDLKACVIQPMEATLVTMVRAHCLDLGWQCTVF